jgi:hypothetical protein
MELVNISFGSHNTFKFAKSRKPSWRKGDNFIRCPEKFTRNREERKERGF